MIFCPYCNTLCRIEEAMQMTIVCHSCPYSKTIDSIVSLNFVENFKLKTKNEILENETKFGNKSAVECPKCGNNEALFKEVQTRSADEPMTIFYQCCKCEYNWKV